MGSSGQHPRVGSEQPQDSPQKVISDLEQKLRAEIALREEAERKIKRQDEIMRHLNTLGGELRDRLERYDPRHERIRPDELLLVSRYCSGVGRDIELIEKFSKADRVLRWTKSMFFEPLRALDEARGDFGRKIYNSCVRAQNAMTVIDMEALARYTLSSVQAYAAHVQKPVTLDGGPLAVHGEKLSLALQQMSDDTATSPIEQDLALMQAARFAYRAYIAEHIAHYDALPEQAKSMLLLRDHKFNHDWSGVTSEINELEKRQINSVPLLGMPSTETATYKGHVKSMQEYEQMHRVDLGWFRNLPDDLSAFYTE